MHRRGRNPWGAGVRIKRAKGKTYYYWAKAKPWAPLPDPTKDADGFMRALARLQRKAAATGDVRGDGSFARLVADWKASPEFKGKADATRESYTRAIDRLVRAYAGAPLTDIDRFDFQSRVMDANADTPGAANMMLTAFNAFARWAEKRVPGFDNPAAKIERFTQHTPYEPWPEHVLEAALDSEDGPFRLAVALHYFTGQRTGDVCRMTWGMIGPDGIQVRQQKTGKLLTIPIHPQLEQELAEAARGDSLLILQNRRCGRLSPQTFRGWAQEFASALGASVVSHGLRKNAVIALLEAGASVQDTADVTGQSIRMVEHYARSRNQAKGAKRAIALMPGTRRERENQTTKGKPAK